ncbi:MAG: M14 family zinc carboxypeptidase, partial [Bythopirellula sp.]
MFTWEDFPHYRVSPAIHSDLRHEDVVRELANFQSLGFENVAVANLGESIEGRSISLLTLGAGPKKVLAWSQMHGNEPTHTAALLDLVSFLLHDTRHPTAQAILSACQLHLILMLNPDGAERWTRRNAQYIDINRDALHLQSPEGQILRAAVESLRPDFALNLHNHRPHTTVGHSQQPASFSLLVPPVDAQETETDNVLRAKQLAGHLANIVAPHCPGEVSRYNADFMPRCFGEWVQQQGAATITVEAGGWSTVDAEPLVQLHFYGLVACLEAIATEEFLEVGTHVYENLHRTGEHDLFDKLLRDVTIVNGLDQEPFHADLGINFSQTVPTTAGGRIVDLGDLHVTSGKIVTQGNNYACLPGRIAWLPEVTPSQLPSAQTVANLLAEGVTTVIGQVNLDSGTELADLQKLNHEYESPINVGFLGKLMAWSPELLDRLVRAISQGALAVLGEGLPTEVKLYLSLFNFPVVSKDVLASATGGATTIAACASLTQQRATAVGLQQRGAIRLGEIADLVMLTVPT